MGRGEAGIGRDAAAAKGGPLTIAEAEVASKFLQQGAGVAKDLMAAAKATDCEYVALRWRDVEIARPKTSAGDETVMEPVKAPAGRPGTRLIYRASDECITVRVGGRELPAILAVVARTTENMSSSGNPVRQYLCRWTKASKS